MSSEWDPIYLSDDELIQLAVRELRENGMVSLDVLAELDARGLRVERFV